MATNKKAEEKELTLSEVQEQVAAMIKQAQEEARKIVEEAKAAAGKKSSGMTVEELAAHKAYMNEEVEVKLFKDNGKYKDDVFVSVNGETLAIKRGERVRIKRKFAEVLDHQERQDLETAELIERKSGEWSRASENL